MTGCTSGGYDQLETSPETIEHELRHAVYERRQTDRLMETYSIDTRSSRCNNALAYNGRNGSCLYAYVAGYLIRGEAQMAYN